MDPLGAPSPEEARLLRPNVDFPRNQIDPVKTRWEHHRHTPSVSIGLRGVGSGQRGAMYVVGRQQENAHDLRRG